MLQVGVVEDAGARTGVFHWPVLTPRYGYTRRSETNMKSWERKIAPLGFLLAGVLFLVAAVVPTFRGQPLNATFLPLGVVFIVLGFIMWRKMQNPPKV